MENKMEYEIKEETLVVYFYGEIDGSNVCIVISSMLF